MSASEKKLFRGKTTLLQRAPSLGTIEAKGGDVRSWLNGLVTCDLLPKKVGEGAFGLCVGKTGKVVAELFIVLLAEDRFLIGLERSLLSPVTEHLDKHLVMEDVELADISGETTWAFLHGEPSATYAETILNTGSSCAPLDFAGTSGYALIYPPAKAEAIESAIVAHGGDTLLILDDAAWDSFRIEHGIPRYGSDFDETSYPQEAALERFGVSFSKGCYLGQEAVFMLQMRGHVKKRLVQLHVSGSATIEKGAAIALPDGTDVGSVTSVTTTDDGRTLALGHVKYKYAKPGERFTVGGLQAESTDAIPAPKE